MCRLELCRGIDVKTEFSHCVCFHPVRCRFEKCEEYLLFVVRPSRSTKEKTVSMPCIKLLCESAAAVGVRLSRVIERGAPSNRKASFGGGVATVKSSEQRMLL
jgi:hypothetical protein